MQILRILHRLGKKILKRMPPIYFGHFPKNAPLGSVLLFPFDARILRCGLTAILEFKQETSGKVLDWRQLEEDLSCFSSIDDFLKDKSSFLSRLEKETRLQEDELFCLFVRDAKQQEILQSIARRIQSILAQEESQWEMDEAKNAILIRLRDIHWRIEKEHFSNMAAMQKLSVIKLDSVPCIILHALRRINSIFNILDRLEIRGRDSAGFVITLSFTSEGYKEFSRCLEQNSLMEKFLERKQLTELVSLSIRECVLPNGHTVSFIFKVCNPVGKLGDNVTELRKLIQEDYLFHYALANSSQPIQYLSHTRWASNGIINIYNCHPLDNALVCVTKSMEEEIPELESHSVYQNKGHIFAVLNGDIDNYDELKEKIAQEQNVQISERITTDAKIISTAVQQEVQKGLSVEQAFRKAVFGFTGSHAIALQSDLEPGKVFLALRGSGQAIYVGIAADRYIVASEVYGIVEDTEYYLAMDGETPRVQGKPETQGQIFILDHNKGGLEGIQAFYYDGIPIKLAPEKIKKAEITTRDIDRQNFPHFFAKEVHQASSSMINTIKGKFQYLENKIYIEQEKILSPKILEALQKGKIKKIYTIGQGTASIAAFAIAYRMEKTLESFQVRGIKSSELSGFYLKPDMSDILVIAVTQSGTTTDTNRAIDMVKKRGAYTMAIVNRRNSQVTTMVDSVFYTSDGRDIEMSVASTKAFYSQVTAGEILTTAIGQATQSISSQEILSRIESLKNLPALLSHVIAQKEKIAELAEKWSLLRRHWAIVGSGANYVAAQEIRIKLSELCYKSIACDYIEDKKHIDLSSEPMVLVCAAGSPPSVLGDIIKDVAIFKAHNSLPIVITQEGERRFDPYAMGIIEVPKADELSSLILNTLAGHLFGYYSALSIHRQSRFFAGLRDRLVMNLTQGSQSSLERNVEIQKDILQFSKEFHQRRQQGLFHSSLSPSTCAEITMLLAHATGRMSRQQFYEEFGQVATPTSILNVLVDRLHRAVEEMARPIDAIKHQAKTVTVGTSRLEMDDHGILFDAMAKASIPPETLRDHIFQRLRQLQHAIANIKGYSYYQIQNLNISGQPTKESTVRLLRREGFAASLPSRSANAPVPLVGTKRSVVQKGDLFIGYGLGDSRPILIIPIFSPQGVVTHQILFHIDFAEKITKEEAKAMVYSQYEEIQNMVTEANIPWSDNLLNLVPVHILCCNDAQDIARSIMDGVAREST